MGSLRQAMMAAVVSAPMFLTASGSASAQGPSIKINPEDVVYKNIPGNEFTMKFTSAAAPEGRMITIDPDDMVPVTIVSQNRTVLAPRWRFMEKINHNLPAVPGGPSLSQLTAIMNSDKANTIQSETVMSHYLHLVCDHKVPMQEIDEAMRQSHPKRGLPMPPPSPLAQPCK